MLITATIKKIRCFSPKLARVYDDETRRAGRAANVFKDKKGRAFHQR
jgi:hypothetical protein